MPALPSRRARVLLLAAGAAPVLLLFAATIVGVVSLDGDSVSVGRRNGPWTRIPTWQAQAAALGVLVPLATLFSLRLLRSKLRLWRGGAVQPGVPARGLTPGERAVWRGRQGWRGVGIARPALAALAAVAPVLLAWWLWRIWTAPDPLLLKLFWSAAATIVLGGPAAAALVAGRVPALRLARDLFGTTVVTDRRIAWLSPRRGRVYREIAAGDLVAAAFVEGGERRGWITVTTRRAGRVAEIDLRGVPRPDDALAAITRLIR